jgi:hypothetical protein
MGGQSIQYNTTGTWPNLGLPYVLDAGITVNGGSLALPGPP